MTSEPYNPDDLEFLISRDIDGDLSEEEKLLLSDALAGSDSLRNEADQLRSVSRLAGRWGSAAPNIDWESHEKLTCAMLSDDGTQDGALSQVLGKWGRHAGIDEDRFATDVMRKVRGDRRRWIYPVFRIGAPLAAAAAVVLTVSSLLWFDSSAPPVSVVQIARQSRVDRTAVTERALVSFSRESVTEKQIDAAPGVAFLTLGATSDTDSFSEAAPL